MFCVRPLMCTGRPPAKPRAENTDVFEVLFAKRHHTEDLRQTLAEAAAAERTQLASSSYVRLKRQRHLSYLFTVHCVCPVDLTAHSCCCTRVTR